MIFERIVLTILCFLRVKEAMKFGGLNLSVGPASCDHSGTNFSHHDANNSR